VHTRSPAQILREENIDPGRPGGVGDQEARRRRVSGLIYQRQLRSGDADRPRLRDLRATLSVAAGEIPGSQRVCRPALSNHHPRGLRQPGPSRRVLRLVRDGMAIPLPAQASRWAQRSNQR
jgi:hypothetical protein